MIDIDELEHLRPSSFDSEQAKNWYKNYLGDQKKSLFQKFPVVTNTNHQSICPICEGVFSSRITLEHLIPKGEGGDYRFAILPINLIKCCGECNTSKHSKKSDSPETSEISPYFEQVDISSRLNIVFEDIEQGYFPKVEFSGGSSIEEQRIAQFIKNYNLEKTYNHRVKLEYQKMLTVLAGQIVTRNKFLIQGFLEQQIDSYKMNSNSEKIVDDYWIDQSYFGYLLCQSLLEVMRTDASVFDKLYQTIQSYRQSSAGLVFSKVDFLEELAGVTTLEELDSLLNGHHDDCQRYYNHLKKQGLPFNFPNLFLDQSDRLGKKEVVEKAVIHYLDNNKSFEGFASKLLLLLN